MDVSTRKKILLVDDDRLLIFSFKDAIKYAGFEVDTASNGKEAWEKIQQSPPDLVVLDAVMPEMNGFEVTRKVRADEKLRGIPIIILTGLRSPQDASDAKHVGADEVLIKPTSTEKILERIRFLLRKPILK